MKVHFIIGVALLILLTTITVNQKIIITKFNIKEIILVNSISLKEKDVKRSLSVIYNKNLLFLKNKEIEEILVQFTSIESFYLDKKYPNTLKITIIEKKPIAILINNKKKFYISEKLDQFEFNDKNFNQDLPIVFGNKDDFKIFYKNLIKIDFPVNLIIKYMLYESNRWDLETIDNKTIKLSSKNYVKNLKNYLNIKKKNNFKKFKVFDYRINDQLILK
jgi:cell division septal protein FtsQ